MQLLRFVSVAALACWAGGLVAMAAIVAPGLFDALAAGDPTGGRELAGRLFGALFADFQILAWIAAGITITSLALRAAIGPRPQKLAIRLWAIAAMVAASLVTQFVITPAIDQIRVQTVGPVAALATADPTRIYFGRLHGASTLLMLLTVTGALGLIWAEVKDRH
jgi:hypothetical protein